MNILHRLKLQQKFKSFKQRHNNVFRKGFRSQAQNLRGSSRFRASSSSHSEDTEQEEEGEGEEGKRYGKRIDLIRKKLREVLEYTKSKVKEEGETTSLERTFRPAYLKTRTIEPTRTLELDLTTNTAVLIDRDIFKPKFRKNMLGRLGARLGPDSEESVEEEEVLVATVSSAEADYSEAVEVVSGQVEAESVTVEVPRPSTAPLPSTKQVSGIPRRFSYSEDTDHSGFVNIETELESGESQDVETVLTSNNDRIDVGGLQYKEVGILACEACDVTSCPGCAGRGAGGWGPAAGAPLQRVPQPGPHHPARARAGQPPAHPALAALQPRHHHHHAGEAQCWGPARHV